MPHIQGTMFPGRSQRQLQAFAEAVVQNAVDIPGCDAGHVSAAVRLCERSRWDGEVCLPDIDANQDLVIRPAYGQGETYLEGENS